MSNHRLRRFLATLVLGLGLAALPFAVSLDGLDVDAVRYGRALRSRRLVGVRGVGLTYDGNYYVKEVSHQIRRGAYRQRFTITREGLGALTPAVVP